MLGITRLLQLVRAPLAALLGLVACDAAYSDRSGPQERIACCDLLDPTCASRGDVETVVEVLEQMGVDSSLTSVEVRFDAECGTGDVEASIALEQDLGNGAEPSALSLVSESDPQAWAKSCNRDAAETWSCCCEWDNGPRNGCYCFQI